MKRLLIVCLIASGISQVSMATPSHLRPQGNGLSPTRIVTKNAQGYVNPKILPKKAQRLLQLTHDDNNGPDSEDLDLQSPYRRPKVVDIKYNDIDDLPDHIMARLKTARELALAKHKEMWG